MQHEALWEPNCIVDETARLGECVRLWNWVRVREHAVIGDGTSCGDLVHIGPFVQVGNGCRIGNGAQIHQAASIGDHVFIGPGAFIGNDRYPMVGKDWQPQNVFIGNDVVIGACACIMGGVRIEHGAVIGMGAVVIDDVPAGVVVCGNPAKPKARRPMHYAGTAAEHWGTYGPGDVCPYCKRLGLEQPPFTGLEALEDAGQSE